MVLPGACQVRINPYTVYLFHMSLSNESDWAAWSAMELITTRCHSVSCLASSVLHEKPQNRSDRKPYRLDNSAVFVSAAPTALLRFFFLSDLRCSTSDTSVCILAVVFRTYCIMRTTRARAAGDAGKPSVADSPSPTALVSEPTAAAAVQSASLAQAAATALIPVVVATAAKAVVTAPKRGAAARSGRSAAKMSRCARSF